MLSSFGFDLQFAVYYILPFNFFKQRLFNISESEIISFIFSD